MKNQRAMFECCGQHIELIPNGDGKLLSRLTCTPRRFCENRWECNKLIAVHRKCEEIENDVKELVER